MVDVDHCLLTTMRGGTCRYSFGPMCTSTVPRNHYPGIVRCLPYTNLKTNVALCSVHFRCKPDFLVPLPLLRDLCPALLLLSRSSPSFLCSQYAVNMTGHDSSRLPAGYTWRSSTWFIMACIATALFLGIMNCKIEMIHDTAHKCYRQLSLQLHYPYTTGHA